jgi:hypothetical protein
LKDVDFFLIKNRLKEIAKIKTSPHSIAAGFAIGTFIAVLPTFGFGIFIGFLMLFIFKKISKLSLLASFAFWNPFVLLFLYPLSYAIGDFILGDLPVKIYKIQFLNQIFVNSKRFLLGSSILAIIFSIISYIIILVLVYNYQKKQPKPLIKEIEKLEETLEI